MSFASLGLMTVAVLEGVCVEFDPIGGLFHMHLLCAHFTSEFKTCAYRLVLFCEANQCAACNLHYWDTSSAHSLRLDISINQSIKFYLYSPYSQTTVRLIGLWHLKCRRRHWHFVCAEGKDVHIHRFWFCHWDMRISIDVALRKF